MNFLKKVSTFLLTSLLFLFLVNYASASTSRVYVTNDSGASVSIIDPTTDTVISTIGVGNNPRGVIASPDGTRLYVSNFGDCCSRVLGSVSVINLITQSVIATIPLGYNPAGMAITPDGSKLYVSNSAGGTSLSNTVSVINTATNTVITNITVGFGPYPMKMNKDGTRLYVGFGSDGDNVHGIAVIDTSTDNVVHTISTLALGGLVLSPDDSLLYSAAPQLNEINVYDTTTFDNVASIPLDGSPVGLAINSTGTRVYSGLEGFAGIAVADTTTNTSLTTIVTGRDYNGITILPDDSKVYAADINDNAIYVVDTETNTIQTIINDSAGGPVDLTVGSMPPPRQISSLSPAKVWVGLKNSDDVGVKFDLKAEAYTNGNLVSTGIVNSVNAGSSGFNNAKLDTINFDSFSPVSFPSGSTLAIKLYVRNACTGSGHNSGTARLWYNDSAANSQFGATIATNSNSYYLISSAALSTSVGSGSKQTIDVASGAKCSAYKLFGTWTSTP